MSDNIHHGSDSPPMGAGKVTHRTPLSDTNITPCCGKPLTMLPSWDRVSNDPEYVNCHGNGHAPNCALDPDHKGDCHPVGDVYEGHVPEDQRLPVQWGDAQQYHQDARFTVEAEGGVVPKVKLLHMTADPLGVIGAMCAMYEGRVVRNLDELTYDDRRRYWDQVLATHLDTPLESVQLHFLMDGVDRAFTHQLVRQRVGAAYAQESLRFSVVGNLADATSLPPSLAGTRSLGDGEWLREAGPLGIEEINQRWRLAWDNAIDAIDAAYKLLVNSGMPAEEARGLLPQCTATRVHYVTNLRALSDHAGNRLCTQAQFVWRIVFSKIIEAIRNYCEPGGYGFDHVGQGYTWQFPLIADSALFRPICYKLRRCPFKADFDRACTIRERVEVRSKHGGNDPSQWHKPFIYDNPKYDPSKGVQGQAPYITSEGIDPAEWLANPAAART